MTLILTDKNAFRRFTLEGVCEINHQHKHNYAHDIYVRNGPIELIVYVASEDGINVEYSRMEYPTGSFVNVPADTIHAVKAKASYVEYDCIFRHRDFDGNVIERFCGNSAAYN